MAINLTPEEIQEKMSQLFDDFDNNRISAQQLAAGMKDLNAGVSGFTDSLKTTLKSLGTSAAQFGATMVQGTTGQAAYNSSIQGAGNAAANMAMQFGPLGIAIGALIKVITFGITEINKMTDGLYKAQQDIARVGALGTGGMTEAFQSMQKFGYGINEIGNMTKLLAENSVTLAQFSGTAFQGAQRMANLAGSLQPMQEQFMNMGMSVDDINSGIAGYIKLQTQLGQSQKMTDAELTAGSKEYLENQSRLSKLTGQSADQLQKAEDKAAAIDAFEAKLTQLRESGQVTEATRLSNLFKSLNAKSEDLAIGMANNASGFLGQSKQQDQMNMATGGMAAAIINNTKLTDVQREQLLADAYAQHKSLATTTNLLGDMGQTFGKQTAINIMSANAGGKLVEAQRQAENANKGTTDKNTKSQTALIQEQMKNRNSMQSLLQEGIGPVTSGFKALNKVINHILHPFSSFNDDLEDADKTLKEKQQQESGEGGGATTGGTPVSGTVDQVLATIRQRESGGNYGAQAKGSSASGAYQFIDSTWQSLTKKFGIGQDYKSAKMAPKEIQDQIASKYVSEILAKNGGDISKVPLVWYTGNAQGQMSPQALAANNGLRPETYQAKWLNDFNKIGGGGGYKGTSVASASSQIKGGWDDNAPAAKSEQAANGGMTAFDMLVAQQKQSNDLLSRIAKTNQQLVQSQS
jgi:hypothetical protein